MTVQINYTDLETTNLVNAYQSGIALEEIAAGFGKSVRSVIAKLTHEGVYVPKPKKTTTRVTKTQLIGYLEGFLELEQDSLKSLEKGTYEALNLLCAKITQSMP